MKLSTLQIKDYKSFADSGAIRLGQINVLIGRNNSGKSAVVHAVHLIQQGTESNGNDVRLGGNQFHVVYGLEGAGGNRHGLNVPTNAPTIDITLQANGSRNTGINLTFIVPGAGNIGGSIIQAREPVNFIYTYLSKRKVTVFDRVVDQGKTLAVSPNLQNLVAKVARLANPSHPKFVEYDALCNKVLGFSVSEHAAPGGQQAGIPIGNFDYIPIEDMGEGVSSLLGLITDLCMADGNLFLIEELENDIHPEGLKAILEVIIQKSKNNQFIISTHSNIVTKYLGSTDNSKLFNVSLDYQPGLVPTSTIREVERTPEARIQVLRQLGYELYDFDLWEGWLILEESSAEVIIRDYLIPWFAPRLSRIRTLAAGGTSKVEPAFRDFHRLFLFTHLEPQYKDRAWVVVDGDKSGKQVVGRLRQAYKSWSEDHFRTWSKADFEEYYPAKFEERVKEVLARSHDEKPAAKEALLGDVKQWCDEDQQEARAAFEESAAEVIGLLREIEKALLDS
jgi:hypothetical protein